MHAHVVARDDIASPRSATAHTVVGRAVPDRDAALRITQRHQAGCVGADVVALGHVATGARAHELKAEPVVARDDVALRSIVYAVGIGADAVVCGAGIDDHATAHRILGAAVYVKHAGHVGANVVADHYVAAGLRAIDVDALMSISRDNVACRRRRAADEIVGRLHLNAVGLVAQRLGARCIHAHMVAGNGVPGGRCAADIDADAAVAGNDIAGPGHCAAYGVARRLDEDAFVLVGQCRRAGGVGADIVTQNLCVAGVDR